MFLIEIITWYELHSVYDSGYYVNIVKELLPAVYPGVCTFQTDTNHSTSAPLLWWFPVVTKK